MWCDSYISMWWMMCLVLDSSSWPPSRPEFMTINTMACHVLGPRHAGLELVTIIGFDLMTINHWVPMIIIHMNSCCCCCCCCWYVCVCVCFNVGLLCLGFDHRVYRSFLSEPTRRHNVVSPSLIPIVLILLQASTQFDGIQILLRSAPNLFVRTFSNFEEAFWEQYKASICVLKIQFCLLFDNISTPFPFLLFFDRYHFSCLCHLIHKWSCVYAMLDKACLGLWLFDR